MKDNTEFFEDLILDMLASEEDEVYSDYHSLLAEASVLLKIDAWHYISPDKTIIIDTGYGRIGFITLPFIENELRMIRFYDGPEGLASLINHRKNILRPSHELTLFKSFIELDGVSLEFVNRDMLSEVDYKLIKACGYTFRGKLRWPIIRRMRPGCENTLLRNGEEINLTNFYLSMLSDLVELLKQGQVNFPTGAEDVLKLDYNEKTDKLVVTTVQLSNYLQPQQNLIMQDELRLHRLKKLPRAAYDLEVNGTYLTDSHFQGITEWGETVANFPFMCTAVEVESGMVSHPLMEISKDIAQPKFLIWLAQTFLDQQVLPSKIITEDSMQPWLQHFCDSLGIKLEIQSTLPYTLEFFESMMEQI